MKAVLAFAIVMSGCFAPQLSEAPMCGPGDRCPSGMLCGDGVCRTSTCAGEADGTRCVTRTIADGVCIGSTCVAAGCGDGMRMDPEQCDDGNRIDGDGCNASCTSDETCGSGVVDPREQCDDGHAAIGDDGCSALCFIEPEQWLQHRPTSLNRVGLGYAYDSDRGAIVGYGGQDDPSAAPGFGTETWQWSGEGWTQVRFASRPTFGLSSPGLAYDARTKQMVMFGGTYVSGQAQAWSANTWTLDGVRWNRLSPTSSPPSREKITMVFDPIGMRTLLVGDNSQPATWSWDGTQWTQVASTLPDCAQTRAVFDESVQRVVMLCSPSTGAPRLYRWSGTEWTSSSSSDVVSVSSFGFIAFDPIRGATVHVAGDGSVKEWTTSLGWASRVVGSMVTSHLLAAVFYDRRRQRLVAILEAGSGGSRSVFELGSGNGDQWVQVTTPTITSRAGAAGMYDARRGRFVVFGGNAGSPSDETWEHDGATWIRRRATPHPPAMSHSAFAYDAGRQRGVLFGGWNGTEPVAPQTWEWDGDSWSDRTSDVSPPARWLHAMAYDAIRKRVIVHGGVGYNDVVLDDTWAWDGSTWTEIQSATKPPTAYALILVWDATHEQMVRFSDGNRTFGNDGPSMGETWVLDGDEWHKVTTATVPVGRQAPFVAYDPARGTVVMHGGAGDEDNDGVRTPLADTWEWNGEDWLRRPPIDPFFARYGGTAFYDAIRRRWTTIHGYEEAGALDAIWDLQFIAVGITKLESCVDATVDDDKDGLKGCADPDCWGRCAPFCPPRAKTCDAALPRCGDGACNSFLEDYLLCPADCSVP